MTEPEAEERRIGRNAAAMMDCARALDRELRDRAVELERERRLPADLARKLAEAGFFRAAIPVAFGGAELDPSSMVRVIETVSSCDGSSGWCVMIGMTTALVSGFLP